MLATAPCARSPHFAVHFVDDGPSVPGNARRRVSRERLTGELSTGSSIVSVPSVDESVPAALAPAAADIRSRACAWLGAVVPKRYARRAVTRSLVKRQMRAAAERVVVPASSQAGASPGARGLPGGLWVVRLRAPYAHDEYPSAASDALRAALRAELDHLLAAAVRQCAGLVPPPRRRASGGGAAR